MASSLISSSEPVITGTNRSDFILASGYANSVDEVFPETLANRIRARSGNDLVIGDIGAIFGNVGSRSNNSIEAAISLDDVRFWTADENPLLGNDRTPHMTILSETSVDEREWFAITLTAGQTITIDLDFGGRIGNSVDSFVKVYTPIGQGLATSYSSLVDLGGLGSFPSNAAFIIPGQSSDPYMSFVAQESGVFYIELSQFYSPSFAPGQFDRAYTFMMNVSVTGHVVYDRTFMGNDVIDGDDGDDMLLGIGGDDVLRGGAGDDVLHGGSGTDRIEGGEGNDTIDATSGGEGEMSDDFVRGGAGDDSIVTALSGDYSGGDGDDRVFVRVDIAGVVDGGAGYDTLDLSHAPGDWSVDLASGATGSADTRLRGFEAIMTNFGDDMIAGSSADNAIATGFGADTIDGGGGDDVIDPGFGDDTIDGGRGFDIVSYADFRLENDPYGVTVSLAMAGWQSTRAGNQRLSGVEGLTGSNSRDTLTGNDAANRLEGGRSVDMLFGAGGNDLLVAGAGDVVDGGSGKDTLAFSERGQGVVIRLATAGSQDLSSLSGDSIIISAIENVVGTIHSDELYGSSANNLIEGGAGGDALAGLGGDDTLVGGPGGDRLSGGAGHDIFRFLAGDSPLDGAAEDRIADFRRADGDRIDLSGIDANTTTGAHDRFTFIGTAEFSGVAGELRYDSGQNATIIFADTNGDMVADLLIRLTGESTLRAGDFLLGESAAAPAIRLLDAELFTHLAPFATGEHLF